MFANRIVALYSRRGAQCVFTWYEKSNTIIGLHGPRKVHPAHVRMYINVCLRLMRKIKQVFPSKHCSTWIQKENIATELFFSLLFECRAGLGLSGLWLSEKLPKKNTWQKQAWKNHFVGGNNSEKRYFSKHKSKKTKICYEVMKDE